MREDTDEFSIDGPLGARATARGPSAMLALIICTCFAGALFLGWIHHNEMKADSAKLEAAFSEMVYVLALPQAERDKLNIAMPDSLRRRVRSRGRDE